MAGHSPALSTRVFGRALPHCSSSSSAVRARAPPTMACSFGQLFLAAVLVVTVTFVPALGNEVLDAVQNEEVPADVHWPDYSGKIGDRKPAERLQQPLAADPAVSGGEVGGPRHTRRSVRSSSEERPAETGYAAAFDALLDFHAAVQREEPSVVDIPDMRKRKAEKVLFFTVRTEMSVTGVRLRVPATLRRVSAVSAEARPDGAVDLSCDVRLGHFQTWGHYDVKVSGVGPKGDFDTTIRGRIVHATIRFRELPTAAPGDAAADSGTAAAARCSLEATELTLVERGRTDVPAVLAGWAAEVEDVPTTLSVMARLLNERLPQFRCDDAFVALVRRGNAAPS